MKSRVPQKDSAKEAPYSKVLARPKSANLITPVTSSIRGKIWGRRNEKRGKRNEE